MSEEEGTSLRAAAPADPPAAETGMAAVAAMLARPRFSRRRHAESRRTGLERLCAGTDERAAAAGRPIRWRISTSPTGRALERIDMLADTSKRG